MKKEGEQRFGTHKEIPYHKNHKINFSGDRKSCERFSLYAAAPQTAIIERKIVLIIRDTGIFRQFDSSCWSSSCMQFMNEIIQLNAIPKV